MDEARLDKVCGIERGAPEPIFIGFIVFGHPITKLIMGGSNADKDLFILHGDVLHGQDSLGPETADNEVHLVSCDEPLYGCGGVRYTEKFVRIALNQFNSHLFCANLNTSFGIDLLGGHGCSVPMAYALDKFHWADHADLNNVLSRGDRK